MGVYSPQKQIFLQTHVVHQALHILNVLGGCDSKEVLGQGPNPIDKSSFGPSRGHEDPVGSKEVFQQLPLVFNMYVAGI